MDDDRLLSESFSYTTILLIVTYLSADRVDHGNNAFSIPTVDV